MKYGRGLHPNSRNGFKPGHPKMGACGAPKGSHNSSATEFRKGQPSPWKGKRLPDYLVKKLSLAKLGKPAPWKSGPNSPFWKGGITPINAAIRMSLEYQNWRRTVFERDGYRCLDCGQLGGRLEADHIFPFAHFPRLRFDMNNGRTLCRECHKQTKTYGRKPYATV